MKTPKAGQIDIGLKASDRKAIAGALARLLADNYTLYLKTHAFHWNVTGPMFNALHAMFMVQYNELWLALDEIAERIRALGEPAPGSWRDFERLARVDGANDAETADEMVGELAAGNERASRTVRETRAVAEEAGDEATADLMIQRMAAHDKAAWMLRATLA